MHRSVQVGIAVLVLSIRVWGKLHVVFDFLGKYINLSNENITKGVLIFFVSYYLLVKVFG